MSEQPWYEDVVMPALLRQARRAYGGAMRTTLAERGMDDIPGNGMFVIGALAMTQRDDLPLGWFVRAMGISKQAASQLVDALVSRGYVERREDGDDRRKIVVGLTERGEAAAQAQAEARDRIDAALLAAVGPEDVAAARRALAALAEIAGQHNVAD